ncbi:MAG: hypothetical protein BLM47_11390 [Candidatus Reconcilbacillus cellulovorans]|uniref:Circular bacteriocin, circularin A/uberolysin family n=1 Tax=Candidatus Reconcilbacillus cellulovorans TaxID=1906605 RepID=A0A2A6DXM7_9BACL|nr:MAG: hypothetical protein BLM47_11390 [Candidatus Reconcilbacillus cellulovorans]
MVCMVGRKFGQYSLLLVLGVCSLALYFALFTTLPLYDLAKEFGLPGWVAAWILYALDAGTTVTAIVSFLTALGTGGLSLLAAAGSMAIQEFLKKKLLEMGRRAFIAW